MTVYRLDLSYTKPPLTGNQRKHWTYRSRMTAEIKTEIGWRVKAQRIPPLVRPSVTLVYCPPDNRRRDVDNLVPTSKACVDGLREAGVLVDDDPAHVEHRMPNISTVVPGGKLYLLINAEQATT